jgi:electron transfer flavoprotein alpha subunit
MPKFLVYSEDPEILLELVSAAQTAPNAQIDVALLGSSSDLQEQKRKLSVGGVSSFHLIQDEKLKGFPAELVTDALEQISGESKPDFVLIGATKRGKEVAPRLAIRLKLGCITDAQGLKFEDGRASANRVVWGGNAITKVSSKAGAVVTIAPRAYEKAAGSSSGIGEKTLTLAPKSRSAVVTGAKPKDAGEVNLKDAEAIVSAGRGFKKKEDLALLNELAETLHAVVGASRPLTSDLAWMPESRQVGLSGTTVKPKLYVAVGISGQIQHLTGMRDSKLIVAINNDKNAPIFQECDYGIVGDLYQVVPSLTKALKSKKGH